jgi:hypothetical protein
MTYNTLSLLSWKLKIYCKWSENGSDTFRFLFLEQGFKFLQIFFLILSENPTNILYNFCKKISNQFI